MSELERIYLDNAATSWPKLPAAVEAAENFIRQCGATSGRGAYASARVADKWVTSARHNLARLLGARDATDVAFCSSGTHALNATISGLLRAGDSVLTTAIEHNSVLRPLEYWRSHHDIQMTIAPCDDGGLVILPSEPLTTSPKWLIVSHASNVTGRIQDLSAWRQVADRYQANLIVDASQTVGYLPIDMQSSGIDILVSAGHKGLGALSGTGFIIARPELQPLFSPLMFGGTGTASERLDFVPTWPQSIEVGNLNLPAIVSMAVAADYWLANPHRIEGWRPLLSEVVERLRSQLPPDQVRLIGHTDNVSYLPVLSLALSNWDIHEAAAVLDSNFGIEVRSGFHCAAIVHQHLGTAQSGGTLRISLGHNTKMQDAEKAIAALSAMLG